jgi:hypothetical protein
MAITVTLLDEGGAPLPEGLVLELLRGEDVIAEARVDGGGLVTFDADAAGPLAVRLRAGDDVVATRGGAPALPAS